MKAHLVGAPFASKGEVSEAVRDAGQILSDVGEPSYANGAPNIAAMLDNQPPCQVFGSKRSTG